MFLRGVVPRNRQLEAGKQADRALRQASYCFWVSVADRHRTKQTLHNTPAHDAVASCIDSWRLATGALVRYCGATMQCVSIVSVADAAGGSPPVGLTVCTDFRASGVVAAPRP